jgi:TetR/AcrR family fatty acid metabolism transcriptional regulator
MNEYSFMKGLGLPTEGEAISTKAKNDKYHRILEAAVTVFAQSGFHESTISQIARAAGVADGTIYLYFKNKDDILVHFFNYKTRQVFACFREEVDQAQTAVDKLRNLIRRHLDEFQKDRFMAVLYQAETHRINRLAEEQIHEMHKMYLDLIAEIVEQGQVEGAIRRDLYVGLVKRYIIGGVDEVINTWLHSDGKYDLTSMADPLVDLFIRGIGTQQELNP